MCPPASPCKGASIVHSLRTMRVFFGMETSQSGRSGGYTGTAPTASFGQITRGTVDVVWIDCVWTVGFVWVDYMWVVLFVGKTVHMNQHHRCCTFVSPGLIERSEIYPG